MAKSKIIRELAMGEIDTFTALKRTKLLLCDLNDNASLNWINYEIEGYPKDVELPQYRKTKGLLRGSYFKGSFASHMKWNNVPLPLGNMPEDMKKKLLEVEIREGIDSLNDLIKKAGEAQNNLCFTLPADYYSYIAKCNDDMYMNITSAKVEFGASFINSIVSNIENRLLDILVLLEKEFGNLDNLDIDISSKTPEEINDINSKICITIYNHEIHIGDGNEINKSSIGEFKEA